MTMPLALQNLDALVLAGGESSRMGGPKALLPVGNTTLLGATIDRLRPLFRQVLVVTRDRDALMGLDVEVLTDDRPERGPLVGLARGLAASDAPWCFVAGCDMPFLNPAVIGLMAQYLEGYEVVVPSVNGRLQPLHAFYSHECLPLARDLLDSGKKSMHALLDRCHVRTIGSEALMALDPEFLSFRDVDTQEAYRVVQNLAERAR